MQRPLHPVADANGPAAPTAGPQAGASARQYVLAATIIASAMAFIDGSVVTIALPAMQRGFSADLAALQWVVNGYTLMLGALILVGGGLGDRLGRRKIFLAGLVLFAVASLACALAPTIAILIAARVAQGVGAALLVPQSLAVISATFPRDIRGKAIGTWAAASAVTTALGPPLGGFLVDSLSWRAAFWINLPLAAAALWLTVRHVPESRDETARGPLDWAGAALAVLALAGLTYGLTEIAQPDRGRLGPAVALAAGALLAAAFLAVEWRTANPVMPPRLFRSRVFAGANIVTLFLYGSLAGVLFLLPFDLISRRGLSAAEVGATMLPLGLIIGLLSRRAGGLADRHGPRPFLIVGPLVVALACAGLALTVQNYWLGVFSPVLLLGLGMAVAVSPLTTAVMTSVPDEKSGAASGVNNAASRLAGLLAVAALGALASFLFAHGAPGEAVFGVLPAPGEPGRPALEAAFVQAYAAAMWVAALWSVLAAAAAWAFLRHVPSPNGAPA